VRRSLRRDALVNQERVLAPDATQLGLHAVAAAVRAGIRKIEYSGEYHPVAVAGEPCEHPGNRGSAVPVGAGAYRQALRSGTVVMLCRSARG